MRLVDAALGRRTGPSWARHPDVVGPSHCDGDEDTWQILSMIDVTGQFDPELTVTYDWSPDDRDVDPVMVVRGDNTLHRRPERADRPDDEVHEHRELTPDRRTVAGPEPQLTGGST